MTQDTQEKIINSFLELAIANPEKESFTMTEIAEAAGISRQAIYQKHFRNTDEIVEYIHKSIDNKVIAACQDYVNYPDMDPFVFVAEKVLPVIYEDRKRIQAFYASTINASWKKFLHGVYRQWAQRFLTLKCDDFKLCGEVLTDIAVNMAIAFVEAWMREEEPLPPEEFKEEFLKLVNTPLRGFFE